MGAAMEGFGEAADAFFPVGEEVYVLGLVGDAAGDGAFFETHGNDENGVGGLGQGALAGAVEGIAELALELAAFQDGAGGEAGDENIGNLYGSLDGAGPVLAGQEFVFVEPGGAAGGAQGFAEAAGWG